MSEKDSESGLDVAQARYYSSAHGRYTSVDPLTASASIRNPQTFNRYSYVLNSPYKFTDPLGLLPASSSGPGFYGCSAEFTNCGNDGWGTWGDGPTEDSQTEEADPPVTQETEQEHSDGQQQAQEPDLPPSPTDNGYDETTRTLKTTMTDGHNSVDLTVTVTTRRKSGLGLLYCDSKAPRSDRPFSNRHRH